MEVDSENVRWASVIGIVWVNSGEGILAAVAEGKTDIEVGAADAAQVLEALSRVASGLQSLSLTGCNFDAAALWQLGAILESTQIRAIGVSNNPGVELGAWVALFEKLPPSVNKYDFGDNHLPDEALPALVRSMVRGPVHEILLDGNSLSDISPLLPVVAQAPSLAELDVGDNDLEDAQVLALAQALPGATLSTLVLGRNSIGDGSGVAIASVLPRTRIRTLHLDSTQISDTTLDTLVGVLAGSQLEELHIDETRVSDAGVLRLCRALPTSKINLLDANDNNLSEQTMAAIEAALPQDIVS